MSILQNIYRSTCRCIRLGITESIASRQLSLTTHKWFEQKQRPPRSFEEKEDFVVAESKREFTPVTWDTSIQYMESDAYKKTYGDDVVWKHYRRNYKGHYAPDTRKSCVRRGKIDTASPCPLCRDEYLTVDYRNLKLLKQFLNPYTGELLSTMKTGVCQTRFTQLQIASQMAIDYGFLQIHLPDRHYDYRDYYPVARKSLQTNANVLYEELEIEIKKTTSKEKQTKTKEKTDGKKRTNEQPEKIKAKDVKKKNRDQEKTVKAKTQVDNRNVAPGVKKLASAAKGKVGGIKKSTSQDRVGQQEEKDSNLQSKSKTLDTDAKSTSEAVIAANVLESRKTDTISISEAVKAENVLETREEKLSSSKVSKSSHASDTDSSSSSDSDSSSDDEPDTKLSKSSEDQAQPKPE